MKKYILLHTQGNIETAHGYYGNMHSVKQVIERLLEQEIEAESDSVKVYEVDIDKVEAEHDTELESLDMYDVAYDGKLIKEYDIVFSWYWEEVSNE